MKFTKIFTVSFFILALLISVGEMFYYHANSRAILVDRVRNHLETAAESKVNNIKTFLDWKRGRAIDFASDGFIKESLIKLKNNIDSIRNIEELNNHLIVNKMSIDKDIYEIIIFDAEGRVVSATDIKELTKSKFNNLIFSKWKGGSYTEEIFYDEEFKKKGIAFSAPILNGEDFLGVIVIKISPGSLAEITTERTGLGETGEVYIINEKSYLITPSRFLRGEDKGVFVQNVDSKSSRDCLADLKRFYKGELEEIEKHKEKITAFSDYRGEDVFGVHAYVPSMKWCVLAEIGESEALGHPKNGLVKIIFILISVVYASALGGFFIGRFLDKRYL